MKRNLVDLEAYFVCKCWSYVLNCFTPS